MLTVVIKKYRNGRLESIVRGVCRVLAYAVMLYSVMAYAMMSFVQVQPVWGQRSEDEAVSLSSPLCIAPGDLLDPPHLQVLHSVVQLAKVGCNCFFCFLCSSVRVVSIHLDVEGVLRFSNILLAALPA